MGFRVSRTWVSVMSEAVLPYPSRHMLRAVWTVEPLPRQFIEWQADNLRESTAHHEAGHSIFMLAFGAAGIHATVKPDGSEGKVFHGQAEQSASVSLPIAVERSNAIWLASMYHAGIEAEMLRGGFHSPARTEWRYAKTSDFERADAALRDVFPYRPHGYAKAVSRAVLSRNRGSLARIAEHLLGNGEWRPADTPDIRVTLGDEAGSVMSACMAYSEADQS